MILGSYEMKGVAGREEGHQTCVQFLCVNHQAVTPSSTIFTSNQQLNHKNDQKMKIKRYKCHRKVTSKSRDGILER
ncbi:MAG: hypothetical protein ACK56F_24370, partial [bacterium]